MLERLKSTFDKGVTAVSVKSESIVESSRVRMGIATAQKKMEDAIHALGETFYRDWSANALNMDALQAECERIRAIGEEIENLKLRLEQIKAEEEKFLGAQKKPAPAESGNFVFCSKCGKRLDASARFCDECGAQIK